MFARHMFPSFSKGCNHRVCLHPSRCSLVFLSPAPAEQHGTKRLEPSSAKRLTDIGTRKIFSSDHDIFRESTRKFFQEEVLPFHAE